MSPHSVDITRTEPATLHVDGPAALIQAIPYLLGFHPRASMVLVGLHRGRVRVTARIDMADLMRPGAVGETVRVMARGGAEHVFGVAYLDDGEPPLSPARFLEMLERAALRHGCAVLDVLLVADGRWTSLVCEDPLHCAMGGGELGPADSVLAAAATYAGLVALPDRASVAELLAPATGRPDLAEEIASAAAAAATALDSGGARTWQRSAVRALFAAARAAPAAPLHDDRVARFGVALRCLEVRDSVWLAVDDGRLDGAALWQDLTRRLPVPFDAAPAFLAGWAAWRVGNGALARIAAERALGADPDYRPAELLLRALDGGLDPRHVPRLRGGVPGSEGRASRPARRRGRTGGGRA